MAYELIGDVHTMRGLWKDALDQPFDAERLHQIKERYDAAMRANVVYSRICDEQHAAFMADLEATRTAQRAEWQKLSKKALCVLLGYEYPTRLTAEDIIESSLFSRVNVEGAHERVKRIWAAMSQAEREGLAESRRVLAIAQEAL